MTDKKTTIDGVKILGGMNYTFKDEEGENPVVEAITPNNEVKQISVKELAGYINETIDFIYANVDKIFTKKQLQDFFDLIKYPTVNRLDIFEILDFGKIRTITFGGWEKFKKTIIDRQG